MGDDMFGDAFGSSVPAANTPAVASPESDPAAGFLAAEQENLGADLGFDLGLAAAPAPQNGLDGTADFFGGGGDNPAMENTSNSLGDGDLSAPTSAAGFGLEDQSSTMPSMPTMMAATGSPDPVSLVSEGSTVFKEEPSPSQPPAQALGAAPSPDEQAKSETGGPFQRGSAAREKQEPECITRWRKEFQENLARKDAEEKEKMEELKSKAKKELEDWHKNYKEEMARTKEENRVAEQAFLKDVNGLVPGSEWDRVAKNCDFNSKVSHNKKDRSRMKSVILQLKAVPLMNREKAM